MLLSSASENSQKQQFLCVGSSSFWVKNSHTLTVWPTNFLGSDGSAELNLSAYFLLFPARQDSEASSPWIYLSDHKKNMSPSAQTKIVTTHGQLSINLNTAIESFIYKLFVHTWQT